MIELDPRGVWAAAWAGGSILAFDLHSNGQSPADRWPSNAIRSTSQAYPDGTPGCRPTQPLAGRIEDYIRDCPNDPEAAIHWHALPCCTSSRSAASPRSSHMGGVNAAHVDGSVLWIDNDIDQFLMARMVRINDGQGDVEGSPRS